DLSRVIQLELQLIEARIAPSLMATADRAIAGLVILSAAIIGGSCLLAALILLLHEWIRWWQCFAVGGLVAIACGIVAYLIVRASTKPG
ncbi:MAG: phage holin family protein, partial [Candidatus Binataceae bacterium]